MEPGDGYFGESHEILRQTVARFVEREIKPFVDEWEEAGEFPRELYRKAANIGLLGVCYPEEWSGFQSDIFHEVVVTEELTRSGSGGLAAGLMSHGIALPPILALGSKEQKERFIPPVIRGDKIAALGITEPGGGSDVANLRTRAVRHGDHYVVSGSKTMITSGARADFVTMAVRTGEPGHRGVSLLVVETDSPGFVVSSKLKKMGWCASDTAELSLDEVRVPAENLLGQEGAGFYGIMSNFQKERLHLSLMANTTAQLALEESIKYAGVREAFGRTLKGFQVTRHKLVDMATLVEVSREFTYSVAAGIHAGKDMIKQVSMAKIFSAEICDRVCHAAVQIHGGYGYMRECLVERLYRDSRILSIGGGTSEIMKEIISKLIL
ncbi:MAG: acyl-CoA dehydrogenase family protein [Desulfomonile tiedjei]|uniref:Acyl-CoA dehydrogenase family protein n=1 Tax=Desulfomonile tiedjei TaxID=2358 RepID=A0A9D6V1L1_9BACT|nr:acyl-CoA dehydrogenase family protein [Desulfomonile tiedjei]